MPEAEAKRKARDRHLRKFYGISIEEYEGLLESQEGTCALCDSIPTLRNLAVDHDHVTGFIRGLLCLRCNRYKVGNQHLDTVRSILRYFESPPADGYFGLKRRVPVGMEKPKKRRRRASSRNRIKKMDR